MQRNNKKNNEYTRSQENHIRKPGRENVNTEIHSMACFLE